MADYSNTVTVTRRPMTAEEEKAAVPTPPPAPAPSPMKPMTVMERAKQLFMSKQIKEPTEEVNMDRKIQQWSGGK